MTDTQHDDTTHPDLRLLAERYELEGELGRGGMAIVYLGRDRVTGRRVAIKVVGGRHPADSEVVRRFAREAYTVAALDHPNIVRTLAIEELGGHGIAIVSAYVEGDTLRSALRQTGRFRVDRAVEVLRDVAAGLAHAHAHRIVHRDVKPENVFLDAVTGRALLGDFGIARPLDADAYLTDVGGAVGTPTYMSPEQVDGRQVDERSDVYSLGLVGWEMLTGQQPWQGGTIYAVLYKQKHEELPSIAELRPDTPAFLYHAIEGALAKDPARRWRNAAELLARLTRPPSRVVPAVAAPAPVPAPPVVPHEARAARRADGAGSVAAVAAVAAVPATNAPPAADEIDAAGLGLGSPFRPQSWGQAFAVVAGLVGLAAFLFRSAGEFERPVVRMDSALAAERAAATPADPGPVAPAVTRQTEAGGVAATPVATASARDTTPRAGRAPAVRTPMSAPRPAPTQPAATQPAVARGPAPPPPSRASAAEDAAALEADLTCVTPGLAAQRACLMAMIERNDAALTRTYQTLIRELRARGDGSREPPDVRSLRNEQRAWLALRDEECRRRGRGHEGALWAQQRSACFAEFSRQRTTELSARLTYIRPGGA